MSISLLCLILACICFFLGAANVNKPPLNWLCAGAGFVVLSWLVAGVIAVY